MLDQFGEAVREGHGAVGLPCVEGTVGRLGIRLASVRGEQIDIIGHRTATRTSPRSSSCTGTTAHCAARPRVRAHPCRHSHEQPLAPAAPPRTAHRDRDGTRDRRSPARKLIRTSDRFGPPPEQPSPACWPALDRLSIRAQLGGLALDGHTNSRNSVSTKPIDAASVVFRSRISETKRLGRFRVAAFRVSHSCMREPRQNCQVRRALP